MSNPIRLSTDLASRVMRLLDGRFRGINQGTLRGLVQHIQLSDVSPVTFAELQTEVQDIIAQARQQNPDNGGRLSPLLNAITNYRSVADAQHQREALNNDLQNPHLVRSDEVARLEEQLRQLNASLAPDQPLIVNETNSTSDLLDILTHLEEVEDAPFAPTTPALRPDGRPVVAPRPDPSTLPQQPRLGVRVPVPVRIHPALLRVDERAPAPVVLQEDAFDAGTLAQIRTWIDHNASITGFFRMPRGARGTIEVLESALSHFNSFIRTGAAQVRITRIPHFSGLIQHASDISAALHTAATVISTRFQGSAQFDAELSALLARSMGEIELPNGTVRALTFGEVFPLEQTQAFEQSQLHNYHARLMADPAYLNQQSDRASRMYAEIIVAVRELSMFLNRLHDAYSEVNAPLSEAEIGQPWYRPGPGPGPGPGAPPPPAVVPVQVAEVPADASKHDAGQDPSSDTEEEALVQRKPPPPTKTKPDAGVVNALLQRFERNLPLNQGPAPIPLTGPAPVQLPGPQLPVPEAQAQAAPQALIPVEQDGPPNHIPPPPPTNQGQVQHQPQPQVQVEAPAPAEQETPPPPVDQPAPPVAPLANVAQLRQQLQLQLQLQGNQQQPAPPQPAPANQFQVQAQVHAPAQDVPISQQPPQAQPQGPAAPVEDSPPAPPGEQPPVQLPPDSLVRLFPDLLPTDQAAPPPTPPRPKIQDRWETTSLDGRRKKPFGHSVGQFMGKVLARMSSSSTLPRTQSTPDLRQFGVPGVQFSEDQEPSWSPLPAPSPSTGPSTAPGAKKKRKIRVRWPSTSRKHTDGPSEPDKDKKSGKPGKPGPDKKPDPSERRGLWDRLRGKKPDGAGGSGDDRRPDRSGGVRGPGDPAGQRVGPYRAWDGDQLEDFYSTLDMDAATTSGLSVNYHRTALSQAYTPNRIREERDNLADAVAEVLQAQAARGDRPDRFTEPSSSALYQSSGPYRFSNARATYHTAIVRNEALRRHRRHNPDNDVRDAEFRAMINADHWYRLRMNQMVVDGATVGIAMSAPRSHSLAQFYEFLFETGVTGIHNFLPDSSFTSEVDIPRYFMLAADSTTGNLEVVHDPAQDPARRPRNSVHIPPTGIPSPIAGQGPLQVSMTYVGEINATMNRVQMLDRNGTPILEADGSPRMETRHRPSYSSRYVLTLSRGGVTRQVNVLQTIGWTDKANISPDELDALLTIRREVFGINNLSDVITHCTAGIGRTGVVLAAEASVSLGTPVLSAVEQLRASRNINMVQVGQDSALIRWALERQMPVFIGDSAAPAVLPGASDDTGQDYAGAPPLVPRRVALMPPQQQQAPQLPVPRQGPQPPQQQQLAPQLPVPQPQPPQAQQGQQLPVPQQVLSGQQPPPPQAPPPDSSDTEDEA